MTKSNVITIDYKPRGWAKDFHNSNQRFKVLVLHRRAGKTTACINHLQRDALRIPNSKYAYIAPTYKQAKDIAWDMLKYFARFVPNVKFNEQELRVDYPNGSRVRLYGADNPDSLRGLALWGVVFDEYSQQPSNIFTEIISPALSDHKGYAIWIGTPKGKNDFYKLYEDHREDEHWYTLLLKASESGIVDSEELAIQRKLMSEDEYNQEYECSWQASIKGAYYSKEVQQAYNDNRITSVPYEAMLPVHTWWDLGIGDATAILFMQNVGFEWRLIDCYEATGESLSHYLNKLREKSQEYGYVYGEHYAPHDIEVRELGTGKSRYELAVELGVRFNIAPKLSIDDGINAGRLRFSHLWIDKDKCKDFINAISQYRKEYDDKKGVFRDKPLHDWSSHYADAFRYWATTNFRPQDPMLYKVSMNRQETQGFK